MALPNPLCADSLSRLVLQSLPDGGQLKHPSEAIALVSHASLLSVGFRLVGLGEDHKIDAQSDPSDPSPLPAEWNTTKGSYAFRYKHGQSSMEFLLKINSMGNKVVVMAMGMGDDRTYNFDVKAADYTSDGNLPTPPKSDDMDTEEMLRSIQNAFISGGRLSDFGKLMRLKVIQKLAPSLHKEGYEESHEASTSGSRGQREPAPGREDDRPRYDPLREDRDPPARPFPFRDPLAQPRRPMPEPIPGFEDEFETQRGPRGMPPGAYPRIGDRDLYPPGLGPNDPLRGGIGPGLGGGMGGGGMHPTFDDPLFAGQGQRGRGYDPMAPPGSRYDDPGPNFGGGFGSHPRGAGMGGRPPNPFGGFGGGDFI